MTALSAFVLGGTGNAGSSIVRALAQEPRFNKVLLVGRRLIELPDSDQIYNYQKFEQKTIPDFDTIVNPENASIFKGFPIGFYALGISQTEVDEETYKKIEHGYSTAIARFAREGGCQHFHYLSGRGASEGSWFLFGKVKAQIEKEMGELDFQRLSIYRPGGILTSGERERKGMGKAAVVATLRFLDRCHTMSIESEMLGRSIVANTFTEPTAKQEVLENKHIVNIGKEQENPSK